MGGSRASASAISCSTRRSTSGSSGWVANNRTAPSAVAPRARAVTLERLLDGFARVRRAPASTGSRRRGARDGRPRAVQRPQRRPSRGLRGTDPIGHRSAGPLGYSVRDRRRATSWATMETNSAAEELPALYRAVLDRVAELEAGGDATKPAASAATATTRLLARLGRPRPARARDPPATRGPADRRRTPPAPRDAPPGRRLRAAPPGRHARALDRPSPAPGPTRPARRS